MSTRPNDPAFINPVKLESKLDFCGLTKREYFAAKVMRGILSNGALMAAIDRKSIDAKVETQVGTANFAVQCADALISELNREIKP